MGFSEIVYVKKKNFNSRKLAGASQKFPSRRQSRGLACPGGLALPRILLNIAAMIGGGIRGVVG